MQRTSAIEFFSVLSKCARLISYIADRASYDICYHIQTPAMQEKKFNRPVDYQIRR